VRLLLDTHTLLWWVADDRRLSEQAREAIAHEDSVVAVSAVSGWEISIKQSLGKLRAPTNLVDQIDINNFVALPVTFDDGLAAGALPRHHRDPFDRMLIAQARAGGWTVVTRDPKFSAYDVNILTA
jgi:PIN domain nuclease of toxin-antitoxin system